MDKTCGTCEHGAPCVTCIEHIEQGTVFASDEDACEKWEERTDSLEQVALDMLAMIKAARKHPLALDPNRGAGGQIVYQLPEQEFTDRLRALGVEVPE